MKRWFRLSVITLAIALLLWLPLEIVHADVGPKPSMFFTFVYKIEPAPTILGGNLLECSDSACTDAAPLEQLGPQHFSCSSNSCSSLAYSYRPYHRLAIEFSDGKTRLSNVFTKKAFNADYKVLVQEDSLIVTEKAGGPPTHITGFLPFDLAVWACGGFFYLTLLGLLIAYLIIVGRSATAAPLSLPFSIALGLVSAALLIGGILLSRGLLTTVAVELLIGLGYVLWRKRPAWIILTTVLLLNLATQPALWVTVRALNSRYPWIVILLAELVVWLAETGGLFLAQRKSIKFVEALLLSLVMNLASFITGLFLA